MKTQKITRQEISEMVAQALTEVINENPNLLNEGWLGNLFRAGGKTVGDELSKGYNKFASNFHNANAADAQAKADKLGQELNDLPEQIKQQVKAYRSKLMKDVNVKVNEYAKKLKADMQKKQGRYDAAVQKQQNYANKAATAKQKYQQLHNEPLQENGYEMVAEALERAWKKYATA